MILKKGQIIHFTGTYYEVLHQENLYLSKPIGKLKLQKLKPIVGDIVDLNIDENEDNINTIIKIYQRKNNFQRPNIANIDTAFITLSLKEPNFDLHLLLKFITLFQEQNISLFFLFTKADLLTKEERKSFLLLEKLFSELNYPYLFLDQSKEKSDELKTFLIPNTFNIVVGQSGVGKSTLINQLMSNSVIKTNEISHKLNRGKHTTRTYKGYLINNSYLVDSPGFSSLELNDLKEQVFSQNFLNFGTLLNKCKFNNCVHIKEPSCEVKKIYLEEGDKLKQEIYRIYKKLFDNIKNTL